MCDLGGSTSSHDSSDGTQKSVKGDRGLVLANLVIGRGKIHPLPIQRVHILV